MNLIIGKEYLLRDGSLVKIAAIQMCREYPVVIHNLEGLVDPNCVDANMSKWVLDYPLNDGHFYKNDNDSPQVEMELDIVRFNTALWEDI